MLSFGTKPPNLKTANISGYTVYSCRLLITHIFKPAKTFWSLFLKHLPSSLSPPLPISPTCRWHSLQTLMLSSVWESQWVWSQQEHSWRQSSLPWYLKKQHRRRLRWAREQCYIYTSSLLLCGCYVIECIIFQIKACNLYPGGMKYR